MTVGGDDNGIIDLRALLGEATAPERSETVNPLTTVSNDVYLLTSRDKADEGRSAQRDSFAALSTKTYPPPAPPRHHVSVAIGAALGAMLVAGFAIWLLPARSPLPAATAVRSTEVRSAVVTAPPVNAPMIKAPQKSRGTAAHGKLAAAHAPLKGGHHAPLAKSESPGSVETSATEAEPSTEGVPAETPSSSVQDYEPMAEPAAPTEPASEPVKAAADEVVAPPTPVVEERTEAAVAPSPPTVGPARPSFGAVTAAIRSVLPAARTCLPPGFAARSGHMVFGSDGTITSVQFPGTTAVDECIRSALESAKVQPFRERSFKTPFVVRR